MGAKRTQKLSKTAGAVQSPHGQAKETPAADSTRPALSRRQIWLMRITLVLVTPLVLVLLAEGALRLCGYGFSPDFLVPAGAGANYTTNDKFARRYFGNETVLKPFPFSISKQKAPGTVRICVLGESAAMGTPDPAFGFGRILEAQLRLKYPERRIEVLNAAMRGINSYVIRTIASECSKREIDAFVIYMGNNEAIGLHSPAPGSPGWSQWRPLLGLGDWLRATRLGQLLSTATRLKSGQIENQDMDFFRKFRLAADDSHRKKVVENFRANLADICRTATQSGAKVILSTVPVNLEDCPPLASLHRANLGEDQERQWETAIKAGSSQEAQGQTKEAIQKYLAAASIDDHFAELHFRLGRCYRASGEGERAKKEYELARDWDALQFRTDSSLNRAIRECATTWQSRGVVLVDTESAFAASPLSELGIVGDKLFHDHVHPSFQGNYLIATNVLPAVVAALGQALGPPASTPLLSRDQCAEALAYTLYEDINVVAAMARMTSTPPFLDQLDHPARQAAAEAEVKKRLAGFTSKDAETCIQIHESVLRQHPDDWPVRFNLAALLLELGRASEAARNLKSIVDQFPDRVKFRLTLAAALVKAGDRAGALRELGAARRIDPAEKQAEQAIKSLSPDRAPSGGQ